MKREIENLIQVKTRLAEKCERLALVRKSKPARKRLNNLANKFRRQAAQFRAAGSVDAQ
jgi:hypothetical protein